MIIQIVSVVGALMILIAYGMIQNGIWRELDHAYLGLNLVGSLILGVVAVLESQAGFIVLEFVWSVLALMGILRARRIRAAQGGAS